MMEKIENINPEESARIFVKKIKDGSLTRMTFDTSDEVINNQTPEEKIENFKSWCPRIDRL